MSDDVRRKVETSLRAAADAVRDAQCTLTSVAEGEHVVYGTRSKLCMALGLDANASGIAIVDAVRAVTRERDDRRRERDEARAIVDRCAAALRRTVPEMATRGGPCLPEEVEHAVSSLRGAR